MTTQKAFQLVLPILLGLGTAVQANQVNPDPQPATQTTTTELNQRDADGARPLPTDQSNDSADLQLLAELRQRITAQDNLSVSAQNIKILTRQGKVQLRGPVASPAEKSTIEQLVRATPGVTEVQNSLDISQP